MTRLAVVLVVWAACGGSSDPAAPTTPTPPKDAIAKTTEHGPVKVEVHVWPAKPTLDDPIYLRVDIDAPAEIRVNAPFQEAGERMGRFRVVEFARDGQPDGSGGHQSQTYTLEAPSSGKQRIPPLRLTIVDAHKDAGKPQELLTDEVPLDIAPVKEEASSATMHGPAGKLDPDVGGVPWLTILLIASGGAIALSASALAFRGWRARRRRAKQRSAYDEAIAQLSALASQGAPSADDADAWFVRLSGIVRDYLEHRYDIRAPELTTEEFLQVAARASALTGEHRGLLSSFLERCDRVKFAGYRPEAQESMDTLAAARAFIEDTRLREQPEAA